MKQRLLLLLFPTILLLLNSCQKEVSIELSGTASSGSLQSDVGSECLPKAIQGVYEVGKVLDPSVNFIDVQVNVATTGTYRVYSDTVNGIFFQATGAFASTGLNTVRLVGTGTPLNAGTSVFTINYDGTSCSLSLLTNAPGGGATAEFTLAGAPGACQNPVFSGDYMVGVAMTPANTVVISVDVTVIGNYAISSTESNGIIFSSTGTFTTTGVQTVTLTATGTPVVATATNIPVNGGGVTCTFSIDVTDAVVTDYFPLTAGSNWSYQFDGNADDSVLFRAKQGTVDLGGNAFTVFEGTADEANDGFDDIGFYRKSGNDYFTYFDIGFFFGFDDPQPVEYIFLKDNLAAGAGWQTASYTGNVTDSTGTFTFTLRLSFTIAQKDVDVTVDGVTYPNTIVVNEKYELLNGSDWLDATPVLGYYKSYYARGVGLIKQELYYEDGNPNPTDVLLSQDLRRYQVL